MFPMIFKRSQFEPSLLTLGGRVLCQSKIIPCILLQSDRFHLSSFLCNEFPLFWRASLSWGFPLDKTPLRIYRYQDLVLKIIKEPFVLSKYLELVLSNNSRAIFKLLGRMMSLLLTSVSA